MNLQPKESDTLKLISNWLSLKSIVHWRQNSGAVIGTHTDKNDRAKKRFIRFVHMLHPKDKTLKFPDIAGIYKGIYFAFEVKRPGRHKIEEGQQKFLDLIMENGGIGVVVNDLEEVQTIIEKIDIHTEHMFNKMFKIKAKK